MSSWEPGTTGVGMTSMSTNEFGRLHTLINLAEERIGVTEAAVLTVHGAETFCFVGAVPTALACEAIILDR
jgi:hypothetical protein